VVFCFFIKKLETCDDCPYEAIGADFFEHQLRGVPPEQEGNIPEWCQLDDSESDSGCQSSHQKCEI
jgi:hypothetical protein